MSRCVNCGESFIEKPGENSRPICTEKCLDEAIEFSFLFDKLGWDPALQYWVYCAEKRGLIINEI